MDEFANFAELDLGSCSDDDILFKFDVTDEQKDAADAKKKPTLDFSQSKKFETNLYEDDDINIKFGNSKSKVDFDTTTLNYYKSMREQEYCPLSSKKLNSDTCFKLYDMWDPYTGERVGRDPYGPLCFDIDTLIKYIYNIRLRKLWVEESGEEDGVFQGYYDDAVGIGEDFFVTARGHHPEWDIFRIPIMDCYLTNDHNTQHITLGPKLTDEEIAMIDYIAATKLGKTYEKQFARYRPSLMKIKQYYDIAISKIPPIIEDGEMTDDQRQDAYNIANREAVNQLRKIRG